MFYENDQEDENNSSRLIKLSDRENITDNIVDITPSLDINILDSQPFPQYDMENSSPDPIATNIETLMFNSTQNQQNTNFFQASSTTTLQAEFLALNVLLWMNYILFVKILKRFQKNFIKRSIRNRLSNYVVKLHPRILL